MLHWLPVFLAGALVIVAFLFAHSLLLPPPPPPRGAVAASSRDPARVGLSAPTPSVPTSPGRAEEAPAAERAEQPASASATRPARKRAGPPPAGATSTQDDTVDVNVRWTR